MRKGATLQDTRHWDVTALSAPEQWLGSRTIWAADSPGGDEE